MRRLQRIDCREKRDDRCLVIADGPAKHPPLRIKRRAHRFQVNIVLAGIQRTAAHLRQERVRFPLRRRHRLAVVVSVEHHGALGSGALQGSKHQWRRAVA